MTRVKNEMQLGDADSIRRLSLLAWIGVGILAFWACIVVIGPLIAPYPQDQIITDVSFAEPGQAGLLGSDYLGRDLLSRIIYAARMSLGLALAATLLSFTVGATLGFTAAAVRGWGDSMLSRINDVVISFPSIVLALLVITSVGSSAPVVIVTVGIIDSTRVFRLARAVGQDISVSEFVDVARARGERTAWIIRREILPNAISPLVTEFGMRFTYTILFISALSFLGLGVQPPAADWGAMVRENTSGLLLGSMAALLPAAAIASVTIAINLVVDGFLAAKNRDLSAELLR